MRLHNKEDLIQYLSSSDNNNLYHVNPFGKLDHDYLKVESFENVSTDFVKIYFGERGPWDYDYISDTFHRDGIKRTFTTKEEAEEYLNHLKSVPILEEVIEHWEWCNSL